MHYRIVPPADPALASILEAALASCAADSRMQADRARLDRACCAGQAPRVLAGAPAPVLVPRQGCGTAPRPLFWLSPIPPCPEPQWRSRKTATN